MKKHQKWIKKLETKLTPEIYESLQSNIDSKIKQINSEGEKYSFTQLFKDAVSWIKEAFLPSWKRTKGRIGERFLNRWTVIIIDAVVCYINLVMNGLFISVLGAKLGLYLGAIIVAPITEEIYKYLTLKLDEKEFGWVWFNIGEWYQYVSISGSFGIMGIPYMIVRFLCTFLHMMNTKIHSDPDLGSEGKRFSLATFVHFMWNGPINWVHNILKATSVQFLGMYGTGITSIMYFIGIIKIILNSINKLKKEKTVESPEFVPQPI